MKQRYCDAMGHFGGDPLPYGNCPKCGNPWDQRHGNGFTKDWTVSECLDAIDQARIECACNKAISEADYFVIHECADKMVEILRKYKTPQL